MMLQRTWRGHSRPGIGQLTQRRKALKRMRCAPDAEGMAKSAFE